MILSTMSQTWAQTPLVTLDFHSNRDHYDNLGYQCQLVVSIGLKTFGYSTFPNVHLPEQMIGVFEEVLEDSLAPWCYMGPLPGDLFQSNSLKLEFYI